MSDTERISTPESKTSSEKNITYPKNVIYLLSSLTLSWTAFTLFFTKEQEYIEKQGFYENQWIVTMNITFGFFNVMLSIIFIILSDRYLDSSHIPAFVFPPYLFASILITISTSEWEITYRVALDITGKFLILNFSFILSSCLSSIAQQFTGLKTEQRFTCFSILYCGYHILTFIFIVSRPILFFACEIENSFCYQMQFICFVCLIIISWIIYALGTPSYTSLEFRPKVVFLSLRCAYWAIRCKLTKHFLLKPSHWLGYAAGRYNNILIQRLQQTLRLFRFLCVMPLFWVGIQLKNSSWIRIIPYTNQKIDGETVYQDHMLCLTSLVIIFGTFILLHLVYPLLPASKFVRNPLRRMGVAGLFLLLADLMHSYVTYKVIQKFPSPPEYNKTNLLVINALPCTMDVKFDDNSMVLVHDYSSYMYRDLDYKNEISDYVERNWKDKDTLYKVEGLVQFKPDRLKNYVLLLGAEGFRVIYIQKEEFDVLPPESFSTLRVSYYFTQLSDDNCIILLYHRLFSYVYNLGCDTRKQQQISLGFTEYQHIQPKLYTVCWKFANSTSDTCDLRSAILGKILIQRSGIYNALVAQHPLVKSSYNLSIHNSTMTSDISVKYLFPEFIFIAIAELLFVSSSIEFFYSQAPDQFRDIILILYCSLIGFSHCWRSSVRIFETLTEIHIGMFAYLSYSSLMLLNLLVFFKFSYCYEYV